MDYTKIIDTNSFNFGFGGIAVIVVLAVWELAWKSFGLWRAAKNNQTGWFVAILLFNTIGILPILYLYVFSPKQPKTS